MSYLELLNSRYQTPPGRVSLLSRVLPSTVFYPKFIALVFQAAAKARNGRYDDKAWGDDSNQVLRMLETAGLQFNIAGIEHLENLREPCVFVCNHMSIMETLIMPSLVLPYTPVTFVVKQSLLTYPVFKHVMRSRNPVAVTRTNPRADLKTVLTEGVERLSRGIAVIVFPQTTRSTEFDELHFGSIGTKLAKKAGVPLLPVALKTDAWQNGLLSKDFGRLHPRIPVKIAFGAPLRIFGKGNEEQRRVVEFIGEKLKEWQ